MLLIEKLDNALQLLCLLVCLLLSVYQAFSSGRREWSLLAMYYGVYFLGVLYWFLYLIFYGDTPFFSFIPDFCWFSSYLFLLLFLLSISEERPKQVSPAFLLIPAFTFGMCIFYMQWGKYLTNIAYAAIMAFLIYRSVLGLLTSSKKKGLYGIVLLYCLTEYGLWTSSCFDRISSSYSLYFFFDILLTSTCILLYLQMRKVMKDELH